MELEKFGESHREALQKRLQYNSIESFTENVNTYIANLNEFQNELYNQFIPLLSNIESSLNDEETRLQSINEKYPKLNSENLSITQDIEACDKEIQLLNDNNNQLKISIQTVNDEHKDILKSITIKENELNELKLNTSSLQSDRQHVSII